MMTLQRNIVSMTNKEFAQVIVRLQAKDIEALKIIYEQFFQRIYQTAFSIIKDEHNAYDIAMSVIMNLIDYPSDPHLIQNHLGFLITMTKNMTIDFMRKESFHINSGFVSEVAISDSESDNLWIEDILKVLTEDEKDIFIKHCIWDVKLKDIAKESNIPYITIKRTYLLIKDKIKRIYR